MNYEERYNQALERAKIEQETFFNLGNVSAKTAIERIFPELRESEDERIKRCIQVALTDVDEKRFNDYDTTLKDCLAWLEKQGEKNPIEQDTEIRDLWVYIREWNEKFGRLPKDEDELAACIDYVMKRQKPAWNEDDEHCIELLLPIIDSSSLIPKNRKKCKNFLQSLKPKNHWKPSEEQMSMLLAVLNDPNNITSESVYIALKLLYNDLKKL